MSKIIFTFSVCLEIFHANRLKKYFEGYFGIKEKLQYRPGYEIHIYSRFCIKNLMNFLSRHTNCDKKIYKYNT
jgi:hypothetical protein